MKIKPGSGKPGSGRPGYNLIELTIVLSLVGLISGLCLPALLFSRRAVLSAQAHSLQSAFWYAQQLAIATDAPVNMSFDVDAGVYDVDGLSGHLTKGIAFGVLPGSYGPPGSPTQQLHEPIHTPNSKNFSFWPGGAAQAGSLYLVDRVANMMYAVTVGVSSLCQVRVYQYVGRAKWMVSA